MLFASNRSDRAVPREDLRFIRKGVDPSPNRLLKNLKVPPRQVGSSNTARKKCIPAEASRLLFKVNQNIARAMSRHMAHLRRLSQKLQRVPLVHPMINSHRLQGNPSQAETRHQMGVLKQLPIRLMPIKGDAIPLKHIGIRSVIPMSVRKHKCIQHESFLAEKSTHCLMSTHRSVHQNGMTLLCEEKSIRLNRSKGKNFDFHSSLLAPPSHRDEEIFASKLQKCYGVFATWVGTK